MSGLVARLAVSASQLHAVALQHRKPFQQPPCIAWQGPLAALFSKYTLESMSKQLFGRRKLVPGFED